MKHFCRFCRTPLRVVFADLGMSPVSNDYVATENSLSMEPFYPLKSYVCEKCFLVQLIDFEKAENMFSADYAYFSSYSESWLAHARAYAERTIEREALGPGSLVVEVASNDGYLLQYFKRSGVPVLGIEPTANTARAALEQHGIRSEVAFFGRETAQRLADVGVRADVTAANNVLAHVPDINDFVAGFSIILKPGGVANFEFPHLLSQIQNRQFDTIYHEHFSYLSLTAARTIMTAHGLRIFDVEELATHGGSLRLHTCHATNTDRPDTARVADLIAREAAAGLGDLETYRRFAEGAIAVKCDLLDFLIKARRDGKTVAGYGAPAKGNTLLNYCGIKSDLLPFTVDRSPHKIGKLLPGVRIPVLAPDAILERKPDYVLILPWNLKNEIMTQMEAVRSWGGKFVTPIPSLQIHA
jgi:SAM-dependent methyltransferase